MCHDFPILSKGRNPHKRTSWKLVGNLGRELVTNEFPTSSWLVRNFFGFVTWVGN